MRRFPVVLAIALAAGCGGHTAQPAGSSTPQPAGRPAAVAADPGTLRFAPGTSHYRYEQVQHATREMMGQTMTTDATTTILLSVTVAAAPGGNLDAAYTIDSVGVTGAADASAQLGALRGKTWHAVYTPNGKPVSFTPPDTTSVSVLGGEMFRDFMPSLPPGTITSGAAWVDTVVPAPQNAGGATIRTRSIRNSQVVGWEPKDDGRALHILTNGTYTIAGEGEQNGAQFTISGNGTATADRFVAANGTYVGAAGKDSASILVDVPAAGVQIPMIQVRRTTLTRLP